MNTKLILNFLSKLAANNNKTWFDANRDEYKIVKDNYYELVAEFIRRITEFDQSVAQLEPKHCVYRINRDIRFSSDKTPYKDWLGAYIVQGGKKQMRAGYYVHLQPNECIIATGLHCPTPDWLLRVREHISGDGNDLMKHYTNKKFKDVWGNFLGDSLKKAPHNFDNDDKYIDLIKMKTYDLVHNYTDSEIYDTKKFIDSAVKKFALAKPVNDFFNEVLM
ncbi:MAG: DUF2461 domain-containing protein [Ignavibacteria bacterium]|jgi:uncharacterized protein (TIGR02453 family)|nr:DUF2461 domain-containing protein [Ignavibacteria bacterium]